jgi:cysteine-rich repeat protein
MTKRDFISVVVLIVASVFFFCGTAGAPPPPCGNNIIDPGETCDPPGLNAGQPDECRSDCTFCGDGSLQTDEECDDGNNASDITCTPTCKIPEIINTEVSFVPQGPSFFSTPDTTGCPGGFAGRFGFDARLTNASPSNSIFSELFVEVNTITNGNLLQNADGGPGGAGSILTVPIPIVSDYSDGLLSLGEFTDVPFNICLASFSSFNFFVDVWGVPQICGNGNIEGTEVCDDGNLDDGDGCDSNCTETGCGNGIVTTGEECDDGNAVDDDTCSNNCTINEQQHGSLRVTKSIDWNGFTPDESQTFEICIQGPTYPSGDSCVNLGDGQSATWLTLTPGSYIVTETDPGSEWTVNISGSPATVTAGNTAQVTVTNTYTPVIPGHR